MRTDTMLEQEIKQALHSRADSLELSAAAEELMWDEITKIQSDAVLNSKLQKENWKMKKFSMKLVTTICTVFCLSCVTALAATGIINGWIGSNIVGTDVYTFAEVSEELIPELEFEPVLIEEFANGFTFESAYLSSFTALDENNERFGKDYTELYVDYVNDVTGETVMLTYNNAPEVAAEPLPGEPQPVTRAVDDVVLSYTEMPYKFVPPNYEMTEEEQAAVDSGAMYMSYGSDEVEEKVCCGVTWTADGVKHYMFGWDLTLGAESMLDMAEELLAAE